MPEDIFPFLNISSESKKSILEYLKILWKYVLCKTEERQNCQYVLDKIIIYDATGMWDGSNYFGASLLALHNLVKKYNYSLVYCDTTGTNCFFVHNRIITERHLTFFNLDDTQKL